ncbi:hypothetical protein O7635_09260 [Asanoa sp. WMMD1127]|uniref:hypothetical protein n=1 Tax=Asanoa sp. WMMD1127 TaxID=3016107 RepID=UPI0024175FAB|nr:hypothetical protein [Asanoa sp. WMMD1127]MDG4822039.1 hypothetical protein [Asanoa sp. WMMD1127]
MDVFSRTFLPAAAEAGVAIPTVSRHMPVLRRCVAADDAAALVARCTRADRPAQGEYLMLLTYRRLVVTHESRVLHRLRLHLNTELGHLGNVTWNPDPRLSAVELAATAVDGVRERFWIQVGHPKQVWHLDALLSHVFRPRAARVGAGTAAGDVPAATRDALRRDTAAWETLGRSRRDLAVAF